MTKNLLIIAVSRFKLGQRHNRRAMQRDAIAPLSSDRPFPYFSPDCSLLLSLLFSKVAVILEPSGFSQTKDATVEERLTSTPGFEIVARTSVKDIPILNCSYCVRLKERS
ncbi:hypothetical protein I8748_27680 [Nostoc sp. CENA67]|uniref:Uncharacterized protein n=1 Tax=Amazonocrinis nigriterrae CENA67 TaxID=2794033 RepID=A0A8J7HTZ8_9NOST|nr:hypothetical protein [Amazonocrinis nigriterrae]MBH8565903.1 hypothetical protein [Amazonocrinis nigriterrae CENA67]